MSAMSVNPDQPDQVQDQKLTGLIELLSKQSQLLDKEVQRNFELSAQTAARQNEVTELHKRI